MTGAAIVIVAMAIIITARSIAATLARRSTPARPPMPELRLLQGGKANAK